MKQPAIQAALANLVEVIRTALTAEFLEYFRDGAPRKVERSSKARPAKSKPAPGTKVTKSRASAKKDGSRAKASAKR